VVKRDQVLRLTEIDLASLIVIARLNGFIVCYFLVNMVASPCKSDAQLTYYYLSISTDNVIIFMTAAFLSMGEPRRKLYRRNGQSILSG